MLRFKTGGRVRHAARVVQCTSCGAEFPSRTQLFKHPRAASRKRESASTAAGAALASATAEPPKPKPRKLHCYSGITLHCPTRTSQAWQAWRRRVSGSGGRATAETGMQEEEGTVWPLVPESRQRLAAIVRSRQRWLRF